MPYWAHPQKIKRLQALCKRFFYGALHTICTQLFLIITIESITLVLSACNVAWNSVVAEIYLASIISESASKIANLLIWLVILLSILQIYLPLLQMIIETICWVFYLCHKETRIVALWDKYSLIIYRI